MVGLIQCAVFIDSRHDGSQNTEGARGCLGLSLGLGLGLGHGRSHSRSLNTVASAPAPASRGGPAAGGAVGQLAEDRRCARVHDHARACPWTKASPPAGRPIYIT